MTGSCIIRSMNRSVGNEGEDGGLAQRKVEIEARLAEVSADLPDVHLNIAEHYHAR